MCQTIFSFLGENPTETAWPDLRSIPLIPGLLRLVPSDRATVEEVLQDAYFEDCVYERVQKGELGGSGAEM